ncbi:cytochrome c biogenesis protein CcdA [Candidatus Woesearchaeota archaeon]|nr:cytochrome c biogenesis protein CcdA [Candidatus Woesearchaeota archaeon]
MRPVLLFLLLLTIPTAFALELPIGVQKIIEYQQELALSITFLIAFIGGILTFTSPCGFVVVPTFFSYIFKERRRATFMTAIFALGMTTAFVTFGFIAGMMGNFFNTYKAFFAMLSGIALIIFGAMLVFNKGFSLFDFRVKHRPNHSWESFLLGLLFATGWTPCVGPILGGIVILAAGVGSAAKGALLFAAYSLGVALPLMIAAYFSDKYDLSQWFTSRHVQFSFFGKTIYTHLYSIIGGVLLIIIGLIMFFGKGTSFFMEQIPEYLPWTMNFFTAANERLVESTVLTSMTANIIGIILLLITLTAILKALKYSKNNKQP